MRTLTFFRRVCHRFAAGCRPRRGPAPRAVGPARSDPANSAAAGPILTCFAPPTAPKRPCPAQKRHRLPVPAARNQPTAATARPHQPPPATARPGQPPAGAGNRPAAQPAPGGPKSPRRADRPGRIAEFGPISRNFAPRWPNPPDLAGFAEFRTFPKPEIPRNPSTGPSPK